MSFLYARRNDTLISKDAWSIWNLCYPLRDPICNSALENRFEWRSLA